MKNRTESLPRYLVVAWCCLCLTGASASAQKSKSTNSEKAKPPVKAIVVAPQTGTVAQAPKAAVAAAGTKTVALSAFETEVLTELNLARSNPAEYAQYLKEWKKNYKGSELRLPNRTAVVMTDGAAGVDEAVAFLQKAPAVGKLSAAHGLISAAQAQLKDMQKSGKRGHKGSDGSLPNQRVERFGTWNEGLSELIDYTSQSAREIVINIILDDGNPDRPHRADLFNGKFKLAGLAAGDSAQHEKLCVVVMAGGFTDKK